MKKLLALLLVAVLAASMSISGFAASVTTSGNTTGDVNVKINSDELDPEEPRILCRDRVGFSRFHLHALVAGMGSRHPQLPGHLEQVYGRG